uniref:BTB domain-containing protein n=1 Tax=Panagrellus redivivus TaxID=6233 RepID=A0A7E5A131_PANRE
MLDPQYNDQYFNKKDFDVKLVIDNKEIPAHRSILSEKSEYFKAMFSSDFAEANADRIVLKDVNLKAFEYVLKYMYINSNHEWFDKCIPSEELFEVLACAQFFMVDLASRLVKKLKNIRRNSLLLNDALAYSVDELVSHATEHILKQVTFCMNKQLFEELSPLAVEHLLKLSLHTLESDIFKALVWWMRNNPVHSDAFPRLLELIELHLLDEKQLEMLFQPTPLIERDFYETLLTEQQILAQRVQKVNNENVVKDNFRIVNGRKVLKDELNLVLARNAYCITIDLKHLFVLNCLKFDLKVNAGYAITVSKNMRRWECVIDHFEYNCVGLQVLYFDECAVRFVSIRFQDKFLYADISVSNIEALYSTDPFEKDHKTGLSIPNHHIETKLIDGYSMNDHVNHEVGGHDNIIYQFLQPYVIGSLKLLLNEESSYYVEVATKNGEWTRVFTEKHVTGWRIVTFVHQPVLFVKIVGTMAPTEDFHLYKFECPARCNTASPQKASMRCPYRQTSERMRRMLRRKYLNISRAKRHRT